MKNKIVISYLIEQTIRGLLKEQGEENPADKIERSFEEDPMIYLLRKYPTLRNVLKMLMTENYKDYITGIYIVAPKPTTFKVILHNNQNFILTYLGKAYEAKIEGKKYYLLTIGERQRAILAIARLLELGQALGTKGPEEEQTSYDDLEEKPEETGGGTEEKPEAQKEEEKTET